MTEKPNAALRELLRHELRGVDPVQLEQIVTTAERVYGSLIEAASGWAWKWGAEHGCYRCDCRNPYDREVGGTDADA